MAKKGLGIRIKNPLNLSVQVLIKDGKSFDTIRTLKPGAELYLPVKKPGEYDVQTRILRYDEAGQSKIVGDGSWQTTPTVAVKPKLVPQAGPSLTSGKKDVKSRRWVTVAQWLIPKGFAGLLQAISIQLDGDCEAQVILPNDKPKKVDRDTTLSYQNNTWLQKGEAVRVKGRSHVGNKGTIHVMIQGEFYPVGTAVPAKEKAAKRPGSPPGEKKTKEPEEPPLRSLGDMIEEMKKEEEVKV